MKGKEGLCILLSGLGMITPSKPRGPESCEQCGQVFGQYDRYLLPNEVVLRCCRYVKNPRTGAHDQPGMPERLPCEAGYFFYSTQYLYVSFALIVY